MDDLSLGQTIRGFAAGQKLFGRYALKKSLGSGAMGVVWLARDEELEEDVALKFLPQLVALDRSAVEDLKRETRRSRALTHKNIVKVYHFELERDLAAISMEYVDGRTLADIRDDQPQRCLSPNQILPWLEQIVDALDYAHTEAKTVHRDLKPKNIMLNSNGRIKIADFGIASTIVDSVSQLSMRHTTSGTPPYMSPQQVNGERPTPSDDIYSLGATLYDLLTGKPPFYRNLATITHQIANVVPPSIAERRAELETLPDKIPLHWEETIAACLAKNPAQRPQIVREVIARLKNGSVRSKPESIPPVLARPSRRADRPYQLGKVVKNPWVLGAGAAVLLLLVFALWLPRPFGKSTAPGESEYPVSMGNMAPLSNGNAADSPSPEKPQQSAKPDELYRLSQRESDPGRKVQLLQEAADGSSAAAANDLAVLYEDGFDVAKDLNKAMELYRRAADQGNAHAQRKLGYLYEQGTGVPKDMGKAIEFYQKAADAGDAGAQCNLGVHYEYGSGVTKDLGKAAQFYQKAADQGDEIAERNLGRFYKDGTGVPKDVSKAKELLQAAADKGDPVAKRELMEIKP